MAPNAALFEDPLTDARMRRTIPRYARFGGAAVAVSAPVLTSNPTHRLALFALVALAFVAAQVSMWRNLIDRLPRPAILVLLYFYCVLIAAAAAMGGGDRSPYRLLYVLPGTFTAVFFTRWVRYTTVLVAAAVDVTALALTHHWSPADETVRLVMLLLVAGFAAEIADMLREALRANRSLHSVLEAASSDPLGEGLPDIGIDAALAVVGWEAGAVALVHDGSMRLVATRGVSDTFRAFYDDNTIANEQAPLVAPIVATGRSLTVEDVAALLPDGHPVRVEGIVSVAGVPIRYQGETIGALMLASRTTRRPDERELDRLERVAGQLGLALGAARAYRLERDVSDRLRELNARKDEFLANVSHELRTPATAISLVASTLRQRGDSLPDDIQAEMYVTLERRAGLLVELINNLLDEAVADAGETRLAVGPIDWRDSVVRWAEMAQLQTGREITVRMPAESIRGTGDAVKLERVVANLLSNAAKFSEPGTPIVVSVGADDQVVTVSVTDHGRGIPPAQLDHVFDRFYQVESGSTRSVGGFGIGLSLTRHFVEAHGGHVTATSQPGEGTTFTVTIPRHPLVVDVEDAAPKGRVTDSAHG